MLQSCQTWSDHYNICKLKSVVTPSLDYWTQAITMSSSYQLPFGRDKYQRRKSLVLIQGPTRKGGIPRRVPTPRDPESFFHIFQILIQALLTPQEFPESYCYVFGLRMKTKSEHPNFLPKSLHTLQSCLSWDSLPFLLATVSTTKKKDPNTL